jgi:hypothetical protein
MARWSNELNIADIYQQASDGDLSPQLFARGVGERLSALIPGLVSVSGSDVIEARRLAEAFEDVGTNPGADFDEDVDPLLSELYDWGDERSLQPHSKICWIRNIL